jgi:CRP-like cAMP-binding protein
MLDAITLFSHDTKLLAELRASGQEQSFDRSDFIYRSGDRARGLYFVDEGLVGLSIIGPSGKEHLMRFFKAGQVFGHRAILANQDTYHATTQVLEKSRVLFVPKEAVQQLMEKYPELYRLVVRQLAQELSNCEIQQVNVLDQQILPRVAQALVFLKDIRPDYRWTRTELANFCASTTSTVIKALAEIESMGYIKQKGRDILILDRPALIHMQFQGMES